MSSQVRPFNASADSGAVVFNLVIDIKALTVSSPNLIAQLGPAFEKYNEEQFATVKLPGSSQYVC